MNTETQRHRVIQSSDWKEFLACGARIRQRNAPASLPIWKDTDNQAILPKLHPDTRYQYWMISDERGKGRIGAYVREQETVGYLGWYECDPNESLSQELLGTAQDWLREQGCEQVIGPVSGSSWYSYRFNLEAEMPLFPGEPFQPLYYVEQWKRNGFSPAHSYLSTATDVLDDASLTETELIRILRAKHLSVHPLTEEVYLAHRKEIHSLLNTCFQVNPLFQAIGLEEFGLLYDALPQHLPSGFAYLMFDREKHPVGLYLSYPDAYHPLYAHNEDALLKSQKLIVKTVATHPTLQSQQIASLFVKRFHTLAKEKGIPYVIHALMYAHNISAKTEKRKFPTAPVRRYALFQKDL